MSDAVRPEGDIQPSPGGSGRGGTRVPEWDHEALLYDDDDVLSDSVAEFLFDGFRLGDPLVVLSTRARRDALIKRFAANGLDWQSARRTGRIQWMDARTALQSILIGRIPDPARFRSYVGGMIRAGLSGEAIAPRDTRGDRLANQDADAEEGAAGNGGDNGSRGTHGNGGTNGHGETAPRVRAYGELVDLLWQTGEDQGALLIEDLWNDLARSYSFSLLCAYSRGNLYRESGRRSWSEICQRHARVRQVGPDGPAPLDEDLTGTE